MFSESSKQIYDFRMFNAIRCFSDSIYRHKIEIHEAKQEQADLLEYILSFNNTTRSRSDQDRNKKNNVSDREKNPYENSEVVLNAFKNGLFSLKSTKRT